MDGKLHITRYGEIPDIPLLLDQVLLLANQALAGLAPAQQDDEHSKDAVVQLTASMVNNYVKVKLVPAPEKKRYGREQVCRLIWICLLKQVMDLKDIDVFFSAIQSELAFDQAYDGFCDDVEALLGAADTPKLPLDELVLAAAQAVAARVRLLQLVASMRPAEQPEPEKKQKAPKRKQSRK